MKASNRSSTRSATMRRLASRHLDLLALVPGFGELGCTHQDARTRHRAMLRLSRYRKPAVGLRSRHAPERHQRADAHDREAIDTGGDACSRGLLRRWPLAFLEARMECMRRHALSSSPWILVALRPHSGYSRLMRRIRSRTGEVIRFPHADATSIASKRQSPFDANAQRSVGLALLHGTGLEDRNHPRGKSNTPTKNCILSAKYRADCLVSGAMYMPK